MKTLLAGLMLVGLGALAAGALAQPPEGGPPDGPPPGRERGPRGEGPPHGPPGHPVMAALDADKDGTLSADEIAGAADALKSLDTNGDGKLTKDELRPPRDRGPGSSGKFPPGFGRGPEGRGDFGPPDEARGPRVLPPGAREHLDLSEEQTDKIDALEKDVKTRLEEILQPEQLERLTEMFRRGPGGRGGPGRGRGDGPGGPPE